MDQGRELSGAWVGYPTRPFVGMNLAGLLRYGAFSVMMVAALMFFVWSRNEVRAAATSLTASQAELADAYSERDRLLLESATRRDLAAVQSAGAELGLSARVEVIDLEDIVE